MDTCDICPNIFYLYILLYIDLQAARYMFTYIYINIQLYTYPKKEDGKYLRIIWAVCVFHRAVSAFDPHRFGNYFGSYLPFYHAVCDAQVHFDSCCKRISLCFRASWCNALHVLNLSNLTSKTPSLPGFPVANLYVFKNMTSCWFHAICIENAASKAFKDKFLLPLRTAVFVF